MIKDRKIGIEVTARPLEGFSHYNTAEFHSNNIPLGDIFVPNETTYIDIILHRFIDKNVFRFGPASSGPVNFKDIKPSNEYIDN